MKHNLTIVGDIHGGFTSYLDIIKDSQYSIQVGDYGYCYDAVAHLDKNHHVYFPGNHDNYNQHGHNTLGDFGSRSIGGLDFFFIRGAFSIDKQIRLRYEQQRLWPKTWFEQEELNPKEMEECVKQYLAAKPEVVLTHDCPKTISDIIGNPAVLRNFGYDPDKFNPVTQQLLSALFHQHKPKVWIFGHYHKRHNFVLDGTRFICLEEFGTIHWDKTKGFYDQ